MTIYAQCDFIVFTHKTRSGKGLGIQSEFLKDEKVFDVVCLQPPDSIIKKRDAIDYIKNAGAADVLLRAEFHAAPENGAPGIDLLQNSYPVQPDNSLFSLFSTQRILTPFNACNH